MAVNEHLDDSGTEAADKHIFQGNDLVNEGESDSAIAEFTEAIRLDPRSALAYNGRGVAYAKKEMYKKAIAEYTAAIKIDPLLASAYRNRGRDYTAMGKFKQAVADYTAAIRLEPDNANGFCGRAGAYNRLGQYARAIPDATEAIRLAPQMYLAHDTRAWAYFGRANQRVFTFWRKDNASTRKAEYRQAIDDFTEALRLEPAAMDCRQGRELACKALGVKS